MYAWTTALLACVAVFILQGAYGQLLPTQDTNEYIHAAINPDGSVHVTHEISGEKIGERILLMEGTISKILVSDTGGDRIEYETVEDGSSVFVYTKGGAGDFIIEYNLDDSLVKRDGRWVWDVNHPGSVKFSYPEGIDLVFINEKPVYIAGESSKIRCHGCLMSMTYVVDEPEHVRTVQWEDRTFKVGISTIGNVGPLEFNREEKSVSFDVKGGNFTTVKMPRELLWDPYQVWLNEGQILDHEIEMDGDTVWITSRPNEDGTVVIIGASAIPEIPAGALLLVTVAAMGTAVLVGRKFLPSLR